MTLDGCSIVCHIYQFNAKYNELFSVELSLLIKVVLIEWFNQYLCPSFFLSFYHSLFLTLFWFFLSLALSIFVSPFHICLFFSLFLSLCLCVSANDGILVFCIRKIGLAEWQYSTLNHLQLYASMYHLNWDLTSCMTLTRNGFLIAGG